MNTETEMIEVTKEYKATKGAHITDEQAQVYGTRIEEITKEHKGAITAEIVLDDAKSLSSPLHDYFEWSDDIAADKFRKAQANQLLRQIEVVVVQDDNKIETKAFYCVVIDKEVGNEYTNLVSILADEGLRKQVIKKAIRELESWRKKYELYDELEDIFTVIEQAKMVVLV